MSKTVAKSNIEALNMALEQMMEKDDSIVVYGEDVGFEGGVFRATAGLQAKFGKDRVFNSPLAEALIAGTAIGMSWAGIKPVVEMQFSGFSYPAFQQMMTHAARYRNRTRGRFTVPMVMRMPMGGGVKALEHHSEALEALYSHIPGLKVVLPSTPYDTKGLMIAAIKDPDPVIFFEHKKIYRAFKQEIPEEMYEIEIGKANIVSPGTDVTIVTYGANVHDCIKVLQTLNGKYSVELIDLRTIQPWDRETIVESVKKTGKLIVVHEAVKSFSISAEIITHVTEKCFEYLTCPPERVTGYDITVPYAKGEHYHAVTPEKIIARIEKVMNFKF